MDHRSPCFQPTDDAGQETRFLGVRAGITPFDQHLACAFQALGPSPDVLVKQIEISTRPDGLEDFRRKLRRPLFHPNIISVTARSTAQIPFTALPANRIIDLHGSRAAPLLP